MTVKEAIERLQELASVMDLGEETPLAVPLRLGGSTFEDAAFEVQNVKPQPRWRDSKRWKSVPKHNTEQIIVVW